MARPTGRSEDKVLLSIQDGTSNATRACRHSGPQTACFDESATRAAKAMTPRIGGSAKHPSPNCMNRRAAAAHPAAKTSTLTDILVNGVLDCLRFPPRRNTWARSIMICIVVPVISVEGGALPRSIRCAAFWIAIAATRTMPVTTACQLSAFWKGPNFIASGAPTIRRRAFRASMASKTERQRFESKDPSNRIAMTTAQNTGMVKSFATAPDVPNASDAPRVTHFGRGHGAHPRKSSAL